MGEPARMRLKVRHYEVDEYGHANHASYVHYLETARVEALEALGLALPDMRQQGYLIVAAHLAITYHAPARSGETLEVITRVREVRGARSVWVQEIREAASQRLLVSAEVMGAFTTESGRPIRASELIRERLSTLFAGEAEAANEKPAERDRLVVDLPAWADTVARSGDTYRTDDDKMDLVIRLARENVDRGTGGPFGAAIFEVDSGRLVALGVNSVLRLSSGMLHAEAVAIMLAQPRLGSFTLGARGLPAHELVTSCEPCAMCLGATLYSGVSRLVIGAARDDVMAVGFDEGPVFPESHAYLTDRGITIVRDVRRAEAASVLEAYRESGAPIYNAGPSVRTSRD